MILILASKLARGKAAASWAHSKASLRRIWLGIGAVGGIFASKLAKRKAAASCTHSKASLRESKAIQRGYRSEASMLKLSSMLTWSMGMVMIRL